ncbi:MAG: preprotein translocase subunit SecY [Proteobacteria bacterium]|nr:preprotein translocase subunit SecY [Pseudomonadota bacterium]HAN16257.1 preprotein translocase subunit SecY [Chloroflexota bacterium]NBQ32586.1 preprotein translocase subunit SecY [Pseudomonadota bacterium]NBT03802.1 preprotein translocase subunit SecY [Pseudomonadota bacterium]NBT19738.1 preprotein translocase subunit SecY [Pseudomonadota bacterium]
MFEAVMRAFRLPDVRRKILFTFAMLAVFRVVAHVPLPGVNLGSLRQLLEQNQLLGMLDLFSGGSLTTFSIAALGVYPYITASIVMQVLAPVIPQLQEMQKDGEAGRTKVAQYTRVLTVPLAMLQAYAQATLLAREGIISNFGLMSASTFLPTVSMILTLTAGTMFLVWLGEIITEKGVGNGMSLLIFAGIIARLPGSIGQSFVSGTSFLGLIFLGVIGLGMVASIIFINEGQRRIMVQYAKRIRGNRVFGGTTTYIPLKVNSSGMIPLIFAMSIMLIPGTIATYFTAAETEWVKSTAQFIARVFSSTGVVYWVLYFWLVVAFTYFYTAVVFQQQNLPETLQKQGGFIPGIRAGRPTADYLNRVVNRITLLGAIFLGVVAIAPYIAGVVTGIQVLTLSSTGILIVVGVVLDTMKQLEAQLMMRRYEGFIK